jgi:hypothetical protein
MGESGSSGSLPSAGGKKDPASSSTRIGVKRVDELRRNSRFRVENAKTEMYLQGFLTRIGIGRTNEARVAVNLSEGGIMVSTRGKLAPGTKVQIRIEMEKFKDVIEAQGEVRWCYVSARNASEYYTGIRFLKLAPADVSKIGQMRAWFTSPEFKQKSATRRRMADPELMP